MKNLHFSAHRVAKVNEFSVTTMRFHIFFIIAVVRAGIKDISRLGISLCNSLCPSRLTINNLHLQYAGVQVCIMLSIYRYLSCVYAQNFARRHDADIHKKYLKWLRHVNFHYCAALHTPLSINVLKTK